MHLFVGRLFAFGTLAMLLFAMALMGAFVIFVLYVRDLGNPPLQAALLLLPTPASSFVLSLLASQMGNRLCPRGAALAGLTLVATGLFSLTTLPSPLLFEDVLWRGAMIGAGMGLCFISLPTLALRAIPLTQARQASGVFALAQQIGFTLGVAILSSVLAAVLEQLPHSLHHAFALTWVVAGGFAAAGGMVVSLLLRTGPRSTTSPRLTDRHSLASPMRGHVVQTLERRAWRSGRDAGKPRRALRWSRSQLILRERSLLIEKGKRHHVVLRKRS